MPSQERISYSSSPLYTDLSPIPLNDAPNLPGMSLASIAYDEHYAEAMSYLRAVMAKNEMSERALALTEDVIEDNPAHYTVWLYRAKIVLGLEKRTDNKGRTMMVSLEERLRGELKWVEEKATTNLKNYQIWHHRQLMMSQLASPPPTETAFMDRILALDTKNYHVWTYRQWLVKHFSLWDSPTEFRSVQNFIEHDVRNNSAWNHRWYLCFGKDELSQSSNDKAPSTASGARVIDEDLLDREIAYAQQKIQMAPQNPSPWSYLRGLISKSGGGRQLSDLESFASQFTGEKSHAIGVGLPREGVKSTHALDWLADCYAEQGKNKEAREVLLGNLAEKWDPIRKGYWEYKAGLLSV